MISYLSLNSLFCANLVLSIYIYISINYYFFIGEPNWPTTFSADCSGGFQSPINIDVRDISFTLPTCSCLELSAQQTIINGIFVNNGKFVDVDFVYAAVVVVGDTV